MPLHESHQTSVFDIAHRQDNYQKTARIIIKFTDNASTRAIRGFAKILAVIIILSIAAFGDVIYVIEMAAVFKDQGLLLVFCYIGAMSGFMAVGYLLLGKSSVFAPGGQMLAAWIVFVAELLIITLNIMYVFSGDKTGILGIWAMFSPATPVFHLLGVSMVFFLDPEMKEKHRDKELASRIRQAERAQEYAEAMATLKVKEKQLEFTVKGLSEAVNSDESLSRIAQHARSMNNDLLTQMTGRALPEAPAERYVVNERPTSDRYYGRR